MPCPTCKLRPDEALLVQARQLAAAAAADVIEHVEDAAVIAEGEGHVEDAAVIAEGEAVLDDVPPGQAYPDEAPVQRYPYLNVKVNSSGCCHRMLPPATWSLCVLQ